MNTDNQDTSQVEDKQLSKETVKRSFAMKLTAVSFIVLILVGNIWFAKEVIKSPPGEFLNLAALIGIAGVCIGGFLLSINWLKSFFSK